MYKYLLYLLFPLLLTINNYSQQKRSNIPKIPIKLDNPSMIDNQSGVWNNVTADGNYIAVDTMTNGYGPALSLLDPMAFDPYSGTLCFVHRGWSGYYATSSGQLWYNMSTDFGVTWNRVPNGINTSASQMNARYPSMGISNPGKGPVAGTTVFFAWPELVGGALGWLGYAADHTAGEGVPVSFIDSGTSASHYSSEVVCWAGDNTPDMFWADICLEGGISLWKTTDFGAINKVSPPEWSNPVFRGWGEFILGGQSWQGDQYLGVIGAFDTDYVPDPINFCWYPGVSKSTDKGATWSKFKVCDFTKIPKLAKYDGLYSWNGAPLDGDMHVDKNGHVHFILEMADISNDSSSFKEVALVDIFETNTGWDASIITTTLDKSANNIWLNSTSMGLGQMGPSPYIAFDSTRTVMAVQYTNIGAGGYADIFMSYKKLDDDVWSTPVNITNSSNINNIQSHLAPFLRKNGDEYTAFSMYGYELGNSTPIVIPANPAVIYCGAYKFSVSGSTPVELTKFKAELSKGNISLNWSTATEINNMGFDVERSVNKSDWTKLTFVKGNQTTTSQNSYSYIDKSVSKAGKYYYRLKQIDNDGIYKYSNITEADFNVPSVFALYQNYPNPFNPSTIIRYDIPENTNVNLSVYNTLGELVQTLVNGQVEAGSYQTVLNAGNLASGIYFYRITSDTYNSVKKLMLIK
jgi:hypothetical protein